jgi:hypothetical protein
MAGDTMVKKKTTEKNRETKGRGVSEYDFIIISGGGLIVLVLVFVLFLQ